MASSIFPENIINNPIANPAKKRTRSTAYEVQKRSQRLYSRQLEGKTTRQLVIEHANIEQVSETTAWEDWNRVKKWNDGDSGVFKDGTRFRLARVRAPEHHQFGGKKATKVAAGMTSRSKGFVNVRRVGSSYGRAVVEMRNKDGSINNRMRSKGYKNKGR